MRHFKGSEREGTERNWSEMEWDKRQSFQKYIQNPELLKILIKGHCGWTQLRKR